MCYMAHSRLNITSSAQQPGLPDVSAIHHRVKAKVNVDIQAWVSSKGSKCVSVIESELKLVICFCACIHAVNTSRRVE
jgi:hypothetical protein